MLQFNLFYTSETVMGPILAPNTPISTSLWGEGGGTTQLLQAKIRCVASLETMVVCLSVRQSVTETGFWSLVTGHWSLVIGIRDWDSGLGFGIGIQDWDSGLVSSCISIYK